MVLNFERVSVGAESMTVGGRVKDWYERDDVRVIDRNELVGPFFLPQVLEFVHYDIHSAASWFLVQFLVESCC